MTERSGHRDGTQRPHGARRADELVRTGRGRRRGRRARYRRISRA